jgi:hypothetical protein
METALLSILLAVGAFIVFAVAEVGYRIHLKIALDDRPSKTQVKDIADAI